jgi:putative spermidine/putrescine transport system substrate-binding protein
VRSHRARPCTSWRSGLRSRSVRASIDQFNAALDLPRQRAADGTGTTRRAIDDFVNEGVVASSSWPFQVNLLQFDGQSIASVVPSEGATGWADTTMMRAGRTEPQWLSGP